MGSQQENGMNDPMSTSGYPSGMCMCPCGSPGSQNAPMKGQDNKKDDGAMVKDGGSNGGQDGNKDMGNDKMKNDNSGEDEKLKDKVGCSRCSTTD